MKRSTVANILKLEALGFILVLVVLAAFPSHTQKVAARNRETKSEETSDPSQSEIDARSLRNALAQPSDDNSPDVPGRGTEIQSGTNDLQPLQINRLIVEMTERMPTGGEYRASLESIGRLEYAIKAVAGHLVIDAAAAKPSFCSSATYLIFLSTLEELNRQNRIQFKPGIAEKLLVTGQRDGVGVWGRWNANGPGTARLFSELHLGRNFTSIDEARPGDFLKIFWNDQIGFKEFGHSVVFLGFARNSNGVEVVVYWSSNKKGGYGRAEVPVSKIERMLFSRLEFPQRINEIGNGLKPDEYLGAMLRRSSTPEEMNEKVGITNSGTPGPTVIPSVQMESKFNGNER